MTAIKWVDIGNDEASAIYGDDNNYKSLRVTRKGPGHYRFSVNGSDRGYRATARDAKIAAIGYAACLIPPAHQGGEAS